MANRRPEAGSEISNARELEGKTAIVTGASRGIGRAIAIALADAGANVIVHYRQRTDDARSVVAQCRALGVKSIDIAADITQEADVRRLFVESTQLGLPSILVNNAGMTTYGMASEYSLATWREVIDVNLTSVFLCTREVIPYLRRGDTGRIINISSIDGIQGAAMESAYAAAKGGVIAWTKSMAKELASLGITVNAIAPGAIDTEMIGRLDAEERDALIHSIPLGRLGTPTDVAELACFLASSKASYVTGQVMSPNGGIWM